VPHLFKDAPDILHQIVTMVPPGVLVQHGIKVVRLVQNAGEFVVTLPRAYHAGFSHGFNVAEAVNFGYIGWLDFGQKAVDVYSKGAFKRNAVFAHQRLVVDASESFARAYDNAGTKLLSKSVGAVTSALRKEMERMLGDEQYFRASLIRRGLQTKNVDRPAESDDVCCVRCKAIPFLSVVRCRCLPTAVRCLSHAMDACACEPEHRCLEIRASETYLRSIITRLFPPNASGAKQQVARAAPSTPSETKGGGGKVMYNNGKPYTFWTDDEIKLLVKGMDLHKNNYNAIAAMIPSRTFEQVRTKVKRFYARDIPRMSEERKALLGIKRQESR
jgi:predicted nuclease with RNAse H fold